MNKKYQYEGFEFTEGDTLLLTFENDEGDSYKDLVVVWNVGKDDEYLTDSEFDDEGVDYNKGEAIALNLWDGLSIIGERHYPSGVKKINNIEEGIKLSEITPKLIKDLKKEDTVIFKTKNDEAYYSFTFHDELNFNEEYKFIKVIYNDEIEDFYGPGLIDSIDESLNDSDSFVQYLGVLQK